MDIVNWFHALEVAEKVSLISAVIALCALLLTTWQGYIAREHNILSVRPVLSILERYSINDSSNEIGLVLLNKGLGPAEIISVDIYLQIDGKNRYFDNWSTLCAEIDLKSVGFSATTPRRFDVISTDEVTKLLWRTITDHDEKALAQIESLRKIGVFIRYKCMYGKRYWLSHKPNENIQTSAGQTSSLKQMAKNTAG